MMYGIILCATIFFMWYAIIVLLIRIKKLLMTIVLLLKVTKSKDELELIENEKQYERETGKREN